MDEKRAPGDVLPFRAKAVQCPSCFSFNHPEYLPEKKKQVQSFGIVLTCVLCGTPYLGVEPKAA